MTTYTTEIHLIERPTHPVYGRIFDGYLVGADNAFPAMMTQVFAQTSEQAIRWCCDVEKRAWEWSEAKKFHADGTPSDARIETKRVYENFA